MKLETAFLKSKVAQRIFFLFVCCTVLPILVLGTVSFYQVSHEIEEQGQSELRQASKATGMDILERLGTLSAELQNVALQVRNNPNTIPESGLEDHFFGISVYQPGRPVSVLFGSNVPSDPRLTAREWKHLQSNMPLLSMQSCSAYGAPCIEMIRMVDPDNRSMGVVVGEIRTQRIWDIENSPTGVEISIFGDDPSAPELLTGDPDSAPPKKMLFSGTSFGSSRDFHWSYNRDRYDAAYWTTFLTPQYGIAPWIVVASRPHNEMLGPVQNFRRFFPLIVLLTLWVAILVSLMQIRRVMVPLEKLQEGTMQIAAQHFGNRVEVKSGDEFEKLATSFNAMASQLGKQFHALKTISEIDHAILSSLSHDGILKAVLDRVPSLHDSYCFAIGFIEENHGQAKANLSVAWMQNSRQRQHLRTNFSAADLRYLESNPQFFEARIGRDFPDFLRPLSGEKVTHFPVFPIFVDHKPFGALIYGCAGNNPLEATDVQHARQIADQLAVAFSNVRLIEALEQLHLGTLKALARAIDAKSSWTAGHSERVTRMALKIGAAMGLNTGDLKIMQRGGLLHDVGKIGTPREVLDKPGKLDVSETEIMRAHVEVGLRILEPIPGLTEALPIISQHHEKFDGSGYPNGLKGDEIHLFARIFAVADSFDAMISDRPYRSGMPISKARKLIEGDAGTQFDPRVVAAFLSVCDSNSAAPLIVSGEHLEEAIVQS